MLDDDYLSGLGDEEQQQNHLNTSATQATQSGNNNNNNTPNPEILPLTPVSIRSLITHAKQQEKNNSDFFLFNQKLEQVTIVGQVIYCHYDKTKRKLTLQLDDCTGRITVINYNFDISSRFDSDMNNNSCEGIVVGQFIRVFGKLNVDDKCAGIYLMSISLYPIIDLNELNVHYLDIIINSLHKQYGRLPDRGSTTSSSNNTVSNNVSNRQQQQQRMSTTGATGGSKATSVTGSSGINTVNNKNKVSGNKAIVGGNWPTGTGDDDDSFIHQLQTPPRQQQRSNNNVGNSGNSGGNNNGAMDVNKTIYVKVKITPNITYEDLVLFMSDNHGVNEDTVCDALSNLFESGALTYGISQNTFIVGNHSL
ncbi:hypothetical protein ABK040_006178 [Willaertia magna]